jgi:hypothetical protein
MTHLCCLLISAALAGATVAQTFQPDIPHAWDERDVSNFELPLVHPDRSPRYLSAAE